MNETGNNKYSKDFKVPEGFDEVLRNLTREILRTQPKDINKFGTFICLFYSLKVYLKSLVFPAYEYFANELQARAMGNNNENY
jgi:hypothetical protein